PEYDDSIWNSPTVKEATSCMGTKSFVNVVAASKPNPKLNFRTLFNEDKVENTSFVLPVENVMAAQNKFANSIVGFFVGKRVAFPLVQNYVTNTYAKFGFQKVIKDDDVFYFKLSLITGLKQVLEQWPWLIRNQPLILTKWAPNLNLSKDVVTKVHVWVKIHKVLVVAYSEDGLSLIASQIGKHVMLDTFTSSMCKEPWGRIGFARALIEVTAEKELKQEVKMVVPIIRERRHLWTDLDLHKTVVRGMSWILLGDFNVALNMEDSLTGSSSMNSAMCDFKDCVKHIEVMDINSLGLQYTWNQKSKAKGGALKKLDRVMGNIDFVDMFSGAYAIFHPYRILDHSSAVLKIPTLVTDKEAVYLTTFNEAKIDEERFLKQKGKVEWLEVGDSNSAYFHKSIKIQNQRSRIEVIWNANNVEFSGSCVPNVFVEHFEAFLRTQMPCNDLDTLGLFTKQVSGDASDNMVRPVTNDEFKTAMFDIGDDKASGPDALKEINHTFLALVPKVTTPTKVNDYRLISCCNVIYKCISKILTNRIIKGIKKVASENQSAFVPGRRISDNILITQKFMHNYHCDRRPPRCAFKRRVRLSDSFRYHHHCEELQIINVCFVDDLFLFTRGELDSAMLIMEVLDEFKMVSGLVPSLPKSTAFFCNVANHVKRQAWLAKAPNIGNIVAHTLNDNWLDCLKWRDASGNLLRFSVKCAWEVLKPHVIDRHMSSVRIESRAARSINSNIKIVNVELEAP
nr:hypothetical protein [Tanacetum cinerariifolium]